MPVGRRIQCAAHRPPRAEAVMSCSVVTYDSSYGRFIRIWLDTPACLQLLLLLGRATQSIPYSESVFQHRPDRKSYPPRAPNMPCTTKKATPNYQIIAFPKQFARKPTEQLSKSLCRANEFACGLAAPGTKSFDFQMDGRAICCMPLQSFSRRVTREALP